jgi:hypothetical protein
MPARTAEAIAQHRLLTEAEAAEAKAAKSAKRLEDQKASRIAKEVEAQAATPSKSPVNDDASLLDLLASPPSEKQSVPKHMANLGQAFVAATNEIMAGDDCKMKQHARAMFALASSQTENPKAMQMLVKHSKGWRVGVGAGRPVGSYKVSDAELSAQIREHSRDTSVYFKKGDCCFRSLSGSKAYVNRQLQKTIVGNKVLQRSQFTKRLQQGRLGFSKAKRRVDVCQVSF